MIYTGNTMCKCCQSCLETIWWHLVEKRFCYDESIALYEVPEKPEKNNNMFENTAFYDSVSVIAGRAVVTIEPIPVKMNIPIIQQPRLQLENKPSFVDLLKPPSPSPQHPSLLKNISKSAPDVIDHNEAETEAITNKKNFQTEELTLPRRIVQPMIFGAKSELDLSKTQKDQDDSLDTVKSAEELTIRDSNLLSKPEIPEQRKRSLLERRMSRSLYMTKIECIGDVCREVPIIRQNSIPKFYLGSPEDHQLETSIFRTPSAALTSPVPVSINKHGFVYDLSSVVQIEKERAMNDLNVSQQIQQDKEKTQFRDKIVKLRRIKSTMSAFQINHI